jgi:hypothetical protein
MVGRRKTARTQIKDKNGSNANKRQKCGKKKDLESYRTNIKESHGSKCNRGKFKY